MLALLGEKPAKHYYSSLKKFKPPPKLIFPADVRKKEAEFFDNPTLRTRIIRELVYWGRDQYLNQENPDSHNTRIQIVHSLLGPLFLNSTPIQEQLIIDGIKVLVVSRQTSESKSGEQSPLVHQEILNKI